MEQFYLGQRIAALRKAKGMTQLEVAQKLGVTNQAVSKWESDQCCPDIMLLPRLADCFGIRIDALFGREESSAPAMTVRGLPWEDDGNLRAVCYVGHNMVEWAPIRGSSVELHYSGDVGNVISDFSVTCRDCSVRGSINAGTGVICGSVAGDITAGDWVRCEGSIGGSVNAGDNVECSNISGNVSAGENIRCTDIYGNAFAGGAIHCQSVKGLKTEG